MRAIVQFFRQQLPRLWHYERVGITVFWLLLERVFNVGKMREGAGICHQLCHPLAKEFQREKLSLTHEPKEDFFRSQWQRQQKSLLWLIYRWLFAATFTAGVVGSLIQTFGGGRWFIYLTDWGFFLCMFTGIFGAVLVTIYHFGEGSVDVPLWALKFYWASYWTTLSLATLITFIYWIFISPTHEPAEDFVRSQWQKHSRSTCWLIYRWLLAGYFIAVVCDAMSKFLFDGKGFIYLTSWGFFLCMFTSVYGAILVSLYYWRPDDFAVYGYILKLYWAATGLLWYWPLSSLLSIGQCSIHTTPVALR
ncbi:unnamed protein product [Ceratitis capitata]|uniref:(Mediterranean fruit fly) hypothetical protein n=1 Tax=Ceratitis capitata TaxID=7213 RepID=A0A811UD09_CERCA|nr:unnamed protein product [Ceratitis capitata]